ncbi:MAG: histidine phosphatase family protein [Candidatus Nealsonbacteria bacterium]|nr:histidine phosphatase family protein [Candidatus Nealsonbacteria bacterium]
MLQIVLIRPGSTDYDQQERIQGTLDVPLNEHGRREVAQLIEQLGGNGIESIHAPVHQPAQETGRAIAKALGIKFKKLDKMQNLNLGLWQGMLVKDVRTKQPKVYRQWQENPESVCPPEGEMLAEARRRARLGISKLLKRHKGGTIGLVLPEPLASIVRHLIQQDELGDLWKKTNGQARWEILEVNTPEVLANCSS